MNILLGFAPYLAFFLFLQAGSAIVGLWAALMVALLNAGRDWARTRSLKVLELGTVLLFAALAIFTTLEHWNWTVMAVRLAVDLGLLTIVLASLATVVGDDAVFVLRLLFRYSFSSAAAWRRGLVLRFLRHFRIEFTA